MKVLIVYENIPESTDMFVVEANDNELCDLRLAHGNYSNAVDNDDVEQALSRVLIRISDTRDVDDEWLAYCGAQEADIGKWLPGKIDMKDPVDIAGFGIEVLVVTGMVM